MTEINRTLFLSIKKILHVHVRLRKANTKVKSLHLTSLKTSPPAGGFSMIGCQLSRVRILTSASFAEISAQSLVPLSTYEVQKETSACEVYKEISIY